LIDTTLPTVMTLTLTVHKVRRTILQIMKPCAHAPGENYLKRQARNGLHLLRWKRVQSRTIWGCTIACVSSSLPPKCSRMKEYSKMTIIIKSHRRNETKIRGTHHVLQRVQIWRRNASLFLSSSLGTIPYKDDVNNRYC
jgi:hypothetical protein